MSTVLAINQLGKSFPSAAGEVHAVRDVSLEVAAGELVALRGPSGCGKSTLLMAAGGLLEPTSGSVEINGTDLYSLGQDGRAQFRAENIGFVFQQFHLIPYLDVRDNILAASLATARAEGERVDELLEIFGLQQRAHHVPAALSTGEKQRTAMARALLNNPKLILADEPTGNLDQETARGVQSLLLELSQEHDTRLVLATHDLDLAYRTEQVFELRNGILSPLEN